MIDSHCHLDRKPLINNLDSVIKKSKQIGLKKILTICTSHNNFVKVLKIIKKDKIIYGTFGIHPHEVTANKTTTNEIIYNVNKDQKIIGVGETGLDFYYDNSAYNEQIESFEKHILASINLNIPVIVHSRQAEKETFKLLSKYKKEKPKILMHCFTGSYEFAKQLMDLDAYFSASGIITFKKSKELNETFHKIPENRLLIETDSPFLAPVPKRGKENEPSFIKYTLEHLSKIRGKDFEDLSKITSSNFENLFSSKKCL